MAQQHPETLVAGATPAAAGVVQVRRQAIIAIGVVVFIVAALAFWLFRSNSTASAQAAAPPAAAPADISAINGNAAKQSDAIAAPPSPTPAAQVAQGSQAAPPPDPAAFSQQGGGGSQASSGPSPAELAAQERAKEREKAIADARASDLSVKLTSTQDAAGSRTAPADAPGAMIVASNETPQSCPNVIRRGSRIPASLYSPIDSTVPGIIVGQVRQDVFDFSHRVLLIPTGAKLTGLYSSGMQSGQARIFAGFDSVQQPNGATIALGNMSASDLEGVAGVGGKVDFKTGRLFAHVALLSVLGAVTSLAQPRSDGSGNTVILNAGETASQQVNNAASQITQRDLSQQPTMHTPGGYLFDVVVEHDLCLPPYQDAAN